MRRRPLAARRGVFARYATPQRRKKRRWVITGACAAVAAAALLLFLLPGRPPQGQGVAPTPTPTPTPAYQAIDFGSAPAPTPSGLPLTPSSATGSSVASPSALTTPAPSATPSPKPTATPVPVDMDKLVNYYTLDAKQYYSDFGFSNNHYEYSDNELYMLAQLIYGEARGESTKGKIAVANVVMNRVLSRGYPGDTIQAVITAPGQFAGYSSSINPNSSCMSAARQVLDREVWVIPQNVYFFHVGTEKVWGGHTYCVRIGGHTFYTESYGGRSSTSAVPPALFERIYKWPQFGAKPDNRIKRLQAMLIKLGYKIKADGYFGKTSVEALEKFQLGKGIHADGIAGPDTIKALIREYGVSKYYAKYKYK